MILVGKDQIRAARGLLNWTQADLAKAAKVSLPTIRKIENGAIEMMNHGTLKKVEMALVAAGIVFVPENGEGAGVRWKKGYPKDG